MTDPESSFSDYKPQSLLKQEKMDAQPLASAAPGKRLNSDPSQGALYDCWSVLTDDFQPSASMHSGNLARFQTNCSHSGNGPDIYGMVSSILEEASGTEHVEDWNNSSKLFPSWPANGIQINEPEKMERNGETVDGEFCQDAFGEMPAHDVGKLYQSFQELTLMDSWSLENQKCPDLPNFDPTCFAAATYTENATSKANSFQKEDFGSSRGEFEPYLQVAFQELRNGCFEKMLGRTHAFHNRSNSNNTRLQKELQMEFNGEKFSNCSDSVDNVRLSCDLGSQSHQDKWTPQRQYPSRAREDFGVHPVLWKNTSASHSCYGPQHSKANGRCWKQGMECSSPNIQEAYSQNGMPYGKCLQNALDFAQAVTSETQNMDYLHGGKNGPPWSNGDTLSPSVLWNRKRGSSDSIPHASLSSTLNETSSNHLLTPGLMSANHFPLSSVSPGGNQYQGGKSVESLPSVWSPSMILGNRSLNFPGKHSKPDSTVQEDHLFVHHVPKSWHCTPTNWETPPLQEHPDKFSSTHFKCGPESRDERMGMKKISPWFPLCPGFVGPNQNHYKNSNTLNYWRKQDHDRSSDSLGVGPPFPFSKPGHKQSPGSAPSGFCAASTRNNEGGFLPASAFPFPDLMEVLQADAFRQLRPFVSELLGSEMPPPLACPPPSGKFRPMRNRSGAAGELHVRLEVCCEQWKTFEKERKKTEASLARNFPGQKMTGSNNRPVPALPPSPSRVDRLIVDLLREHHRVVTLVGKMEHLHGMSLHASIGTTLEWHLAAIHLTQARRKDEVVNSTNRFRQGVQRGSTDDKDVLALASALKDLAVLTCKARTALWCALQMTLARSVAGASVQQAELDRALLVLFDPGNNEVPEMGRGRSQQPSARMPAARDQGPRGGGEAEKA